MGQHWMVLDDIGSVWGGTGWYLLAGLHKLWNPRIPDLNTQRKFDEHGELERNVKQRDVSLLFEWGVLQFSK